MAFAHTRNAKGLKATSINLGLVTGVGVSTERDEVFQLLQGGRLTSMNEEDVLQIVRAAIAGRSPVQPVLGLSSGGFIRKQEQPEPYWFTDSRFLPVRSYGNGDGAAQNTDNQTLSATLEKAASLAEAVDAVLTEFIKKLSNITNRSVEDIDPGNYTSTYGIDSLTAVEIGSWVSTHTKANVSVFEVVSNNSIKELAEKITSISPLVPAALKH